MAIEKMVKRWFKILFECKKYVGKNSIYQLPHLKSRMNGVGQRFGFSFPSLHGVRSAIRASRAPKINWDVGGGRLEWIYTYVLYSIAASDKRRSSTFPLVL